MRFLFSVWSLVALLAATATAKEPSAVKLWESPAVLSVPESVIYDHATDLLIVANINGNPTEEDGNGFLSLMEPDGGIKQLEWIKGMNAPKGMGIHNRTLYVADIDRVRVIDIPSGKMFKDYPAAGAHFLNDITIADNGDVFISDYQEEDPGIYRIHLGSIYRWVGAKDLGHERPNGLWVEGQSLYVGTKSGKLLKIDRESRDVTVVVEKVGVGGIDGLMPDGNGGFITSDWEGRVYHVAPDKAVTLLFDNTRSKMNAADIWYDIPGKKIYVPGFFANKVMGYQVK